MIHCLVSPVVVDNQGSEACVGGMIIKVAENSAHVIPPRIESIHTIKHEPDEIHNEKQQLTESPIQ